MSGTAKSSVRSLLTMEKHSQSGSFLAVRILKKVADLAPCSSCFAELRLSSELVVFFFASPQQTDHVVTLWPIWFFCSTTHRCSLEPSFWLYLTRLAPAVTVATRSSIERDLSAVSCLCASRHCGAMHGSLDDWLPSPALLPMAFSIAASHSRLSAASCPTHVYPLPPFSIRRKAFCSASVDGSCSTRAPLSSATCQRAAAARLPGRARRCRGARSRAVAARRGTPAP